MTMMMGESMLRLQIDPSTEPLFVKKSEEYKTYQEFSEKFGSDYVIAVAMQTEDLFLEKSLDVLKELTEKIQIYPQVERVLSLSNVKDIKHRFMGIKIVDALHKVYEDHDDPEEIRDDILTNELYINNLVSPDGRVANILIYLKKMKDQRGKIGNQVVPS